MIVPGHENELASKLISVPDKINSLLPAAEEELSIKKARSVINFANNVLQEYVVLGKFDESRPYKVELTKGGILYVRPGISIELPFDSSKLIEKAVEICNFGDKFYDALLIEDPKLTFDEAVDMQETIHIELEYLICSIPQIVIAINAGFFIKKMEGHIVAPLLENIKVLSSVVASEELLEVDVDRFVLYYDFLEIAPTYSYEVASSDDIFGFWFKVKQHTLDVSKLNEYVSELSKHSIAIVSGGNPQAYNKGFLVADLIRIEQEIKRVVHETEQIVLGNFPRSRGLLKSLQ